MKLLKCPKWEEHLGTNTFRRDLVKFEISSGLSSVLLRISSEVSVSNLSPTKMVGRLPCWILPQTEMMPMILEPVCLIHGYSTPMIREDLESLSVPI